ncbi:acylphosphatase-1-like isoform X1 [Lycorma delicatula]|uniref:acylphosphatase-1-like isoform X1 n=1 Tax=Lycorma delicatula TaxID=130591 RepID=UPI003F512173
MEKSVKLFFLLSLLGKLVIILGKQPTKRRAVESEPYWFPTPAPQKDFYAIDFEVEGNVQGKDIMFKECLKQKAEALKNVRGYVFDTPYGTVRGHIQTTEFNLMLLEHWIQFIGSPFCYVKHAQFDNRKKITRFTMSECFRIVE